MKFTIDTEEIKKQNIPKDVFFHILNLYFKSHIDEDVAKKANHLGYNVKTSKGYIISKEGVQMIQEIFFDSVNNTNKENNDYEDIAQALIEIFPKGFKAGTNTLWGGSVSAIAYRLKLLEYKSHNPIYKEKAVQAAIKYVESFDDKQFMQTLPYFLFKTTTDIDGDIEWKSNFLTILENLK